MATKRQAFAVVLVLFIIGFIAMYFLQKTEAFEQPYPSVGKLARLQQFVNTSGLTGEQKQIADRLKPFLVKQETCEKQGLTSEEMDQILAYFEKPIQTSIEMDIKTLQVKQNPTVSDMRLFFDTYYRMNKDAYDTQLNKKIISDTTYNALNNKNDNMFREMKLKWEKKTSNDLLTNDEKKQFENGVKKLASEYALLKLSLANIF